MKFLHFVRKFYPVALLLVFLADFLKELIEIRHTHVSFSLNDFVLLSTDLLPTFWTFVDDPRLCAVADEVGKVAGTFVKASSEGFAVDLFQLADYFHEIVFSGSWYEDLFHVECDVFADNTVFEKYLANTPGVGTVNKHYIC